jgi:TonB-linked SusC/RagA family outer membrane protein
MKSAYLKVLLFTACFLTTAISWSQVKTITGKVISDDDKTPLAGVSVVIKGKTGGTSTDINGNFSLSASTGDVLVFTSVGSLMQEMTVGSDGIINVSLKPDAGKLGEVVVIGYGTQSRRNVTSSISKLDTRVLANAPLSNVGTALQGNIAGLRVVNTTGTPGASPVIVLRGGASINNPNASPLVVVDGIQRAYNDIAPQDIESIEVLKDAASTAIYGARANNGVILITTKQGKVGKAEVSYKYTGGFNKRREGYNYLNARDYIYYNRLGNLNSAVTLATVETRRGYGIVNTVADRALFDIRRYDASTSSLLQSGWDTVGDPYGGTIIFKDHGNEIEDLVFRNTNTNDHYLSVNGGNDKGKYFASFDYYDEDGVIVGSDYKRYSGVLNGSYKIKPNLEISTGATLSTSTQFGLIGGEINTLYRNLSVWPTMNPWLDSAKTIPNPGNGITDGNPLYWLGKTVRTNEVNRITANAAVKYDILPGLYIKGTANIYLFENLNESFTKATQTYTGLYTTPQTFNTTRPASLSFGRSVQKQYNIILNYTKTFFRLHSINAMIGAEYLGNKALSTQVSGTNAPTDDIPTVNASTVFASGSNFSSKSEYRIISNFGRLNYDFDQRYLLSLVYRVDAISRFAEGNRSGFFPGMSAGWNVHREKFFQNSSLPRFISSLKPRISYGSNGNADVVGNYDVQGVYGSQGNYNGSLGFLNTGIINSGLRWEKSTMTDLGFDMGILKNRITLIFDYFDRRNKDLLQSLQLPGYLGFGSLTTNLGELQNKGWEFGVNATILKLKNGLTWDFGGNVSFVKNKILKLPFNGNENNRIGGIQVWDPKLGKLTWIGGLQEGKPLGVIYGYQQLSIFQDDAEIAKLANSRRDLIAQISGPGVTYGTGKITPGDVNWFDVDKNDTIDTRDQVYLGNIYPKLTGGFSTSVSFKGVTLTARFDYAIGHTIYNDQVARTLGNYQGTFNYIDWQKKGFSGDKSMNDIPKVYFADQVAAPAGKKNYTRGNNANAVLNGNNSRFYEKGDYMACREITLSYDIEKSLLSKTRVISSARVFLNANNLFYITKFSGMNPEPVLGNGGIYQGTYPTPRSFVIGIQVNF